MTVSKATARLLTLCIAVLLSGGCSDDSGTSDTGATTGDSWSAGDSGGTPDFASGADSGTDGAAKKDIWVNVDARASDTGNGVDGNGKGDSSGGGPDSCVALGDAAIPFGDGGATRTLIAPFTFDFETSNGGLSGTKDWEWGALSFSKGSGCSSSIAPPKAAHSGCRAWGTKLNDCYSSLGNNQGNATNCESSKPADDSILDVKVTIPSGWTKATLTYWDWFDVFTNFDRGQIRIDGKVLNTGKTYCATNYKKPTAWVKRTYDLSAYVGKTITISFHFLASSVVNYAGWYIDDLSVTSGGSSTADGGTPSG